MTETTNLTVLTRRKFLQLAGVTAGVALVSQECARIPGEPESEIRLINSSYGEGNGMKDKILIAYASRAGSTAGVADAIGKTLAAKGNQVDVFSMDVVKDLSPYRAIVAGSAIRGQRWLPEAMEFLKVYGADLRKVKFASFMVCITLAMKNGESYLEGIKDWMAPVRAAGSPLCEGYFAGALDLSRLSGMDKFKMGVAASLGVFPKGDHRDWKAIETWAEELSCKL